MSWRTLRVTVPADHRRLPPFRYHFTTPLPKPYQTPNCIAYVLPSNRLGWHSFWGLADANLVCYVQPRLALAPAFRVASPRDRAGKRGSRTADATAARRARHEPSNEYFE